jgi:hypothetical protein
MDELKNNHKVRWNNSSRKIELSEKEKKRKEKKKKKNNKATFLGVKSWVGKPLAALSRREGEECGVNSAIGDIGSRDRSEEC